MKKFAYTLVTSLGASTGTHLQAEVPVYRDQSLVLNETLVIEGDGPAYYRNVRLDARDDGKFRLVHAEKRRLAQVHEVRLLMNASLPPSLVVEVHGDMSQSCLALEEPLVTRQGRVFTIAVAETPYDPDIRCFSPLTNFILPIPLDLDGLEGGEYLLVVNGVEKSFLLDPQ